MANIACVLFDLGGVIVNWHNSWFIQEISKEFELQQEELSREFDKNLTDIATGRIDEKKFWYNIGLELESSKLMNHNESLLDKIFRKRVSLNDSVVNLSRHLSKKGITVGILSNTEHVTFSVVADLLSLDHFKYKFLSYEIGHVKPILRYTNMSLKILHSQKKSYFLLMI